MCDTMIAMNEVTDDGSIIFAKNSDREPNEAQNITFIPSLSYKKNATVRCTYLEIPQIDRTYAVLLSKPFWMFGAEMGVNEYGVTIGNEAVFTKEKYRKDDALTGMDILRLALERSKSAIEAKETIIELIDMYGQGGNCSMDGKLYYHNSYIIADSVSAFVLETAEKNWAVKKVTSFASISNCLTLENDYNESSIGINDNSKQKRGNAGNKINFRDKYSDKVITYFAGGNKRQQCSFANMNDLKERITTNKMMSILRDHNLEGKFVVGKNSMGKICMHAGGLVSSQTTGSMIVKLMKGKIPLIYVTGTSAPCISLFKPHVIFPKLTNYGMNDYSKKKDLTVDVYGSATNKFDPSTLWWQNEEIHRRVLKNYKDEYPRWNELLGHEESGVIERIEKKWHQSGKESIKAFCEKETVRLLRLFQNACTEYKKINSAAKKNTTFLARMQWKRWNMKAGIGIV